MKSLKAFFNSFSKPFWVMSLGSVVFCASFQMVIPNMPDYIESLGGGKYKGFHIALFALMALISRPFSGPLTDRIGRIPVLMFGAGICFVAGLGYFFAISFWMVLFMRFFNGMATGFTPTGSIAYTADLAPLDKRGIAMGINGVANNLGMAIGPILGGYIFNKLGFDWIFIVSSAIGIVALFIFKSLPETAVNTQKFKMSSLKIQLKDFYEPKVYGPFIVVFAASFAFGAFLTIASDHSKLLNVSNLGTAFTVMTISSIFTRLYVAYLSDIYGRVWVLRLSLSLMTIIIFAASQVTQTWQFLTIVGIWGLCQGAASPTLFAWTTDKADAHLKGRAYATVFIGLELGIILGGSFTWLCQHLTPEIKYVYWFTAAVVAVSALFVWFTRIDFSKKDYKSRKALVKSRLND